MTKSGPIAGARGCRCQGERTLADLMSREPVGIGASSTVREAIDLLAERGVHCLVVMDGERALGVATEGSLLREAGRSGAAFLDRRLRDCDGHKRTVLEDSTSLHEAIDLIHGHCSGPWLIVGRRGEFRGLITTADLIHGLSAELHEYAARVEEMAHKRTREKRELLDIAVHDLRGPLAVIDLSLQTLRNPKVAPDANACRQLSGSCSAQVAKLLELIDGILDIAKIESGRVILKKETVDMKKLAVRTVHFFDKPAEHKGIRLVTDLAEGDCLVNGDATYLGTVLSNLLSNAIKFSPPGESVTLRLSCERGGCRVAVEDHGQGLKEEELPLLFKRFQRLSARPTGNESSNGLGLAIVKRLVTMHGGTVRATSTLGEGSTFEVRFPASARASGTAGKGPSPKAGSGAQDNRAAVEGR